LKQIKDSEAKVEAVAKEAEAEADRKIKKVEDEKQVAAKEAEDAKVETAEVQKKAKVEEEKAVEQVKAKAEEEKVKVKAETKAKVQEKAKAVVKQKVDNTMDKYKQVMEKMKVAQGSLVTLLANQEKITEGASDVKIAAAKVAQEIPVASRVHLQNILQETALQEQMQSSSH